MVNETIPPKIKRPAIWVSATYMIGILVGVFAARRGYFVHFAVSFAVLTGVLAVLSLFFKNVRIAAVCALSVSVAFLSANSVYSQRYAIPDISKEESIVSAVVLDISKANDDSTRYVLSDLSINGDKKDYKMLVTLANDTLNIGDTVTFTAKISKPRQARNFNLFDYREYLANSGIYYTAYIESVNVMEELPADVGVFTRIRCKINAFKHSIIDAYGKYLTTEAIGIVSAVTMGEDMYLNDAQYEKYRHTGTAHVLAISGLHVGFAAAFAGLLTKRLKKYGVAYTLINLAIVWIYVFISGMNVSAVRAGLFFTLYAIGSSLKLRCDTVNITFITALIMLIFDPMMIFAQGFQLSFAAVLSIGVLGDVITRSITNRFEAIPKAWARGFAVTISATLGVMPLIAYHFNTLSLVTVILNPFIVPLYSYLVGAAFAVLAFIALSITPLAKVAASVVNGLVFISDSSIDIALEWEYSYFNVSTPSILVIILFAVLLWLFSRERSRRIRHPKYVALACAGLLIVSILIPRLNLLGNYRLSVIDIGQAECALLVTPQNKTVMVDAGTPYGANDTADYTIAPYLLKNGNSRIDYLVISHAHDDHMGEVLPLLDIVEVENIVYYCPDESDVMFDILQAAQNKGIYLINMYYNRSVKVDDTTELIRLSDHFDENDANDQSLVINVKCSERNIIFAGDATDKVLDGIEYPEDIFIYKVAHHGSKSSYCDELMHHLPQYSVICTGKGNIYNLPNEDALKKYRDYSTVLLTEDSGAIRFDFNDKRAKVSTYFN